MIVRSPKFQVHAVTVPRVTEVVKATLSGSVPVTGFAATVISGPAAGGTVTVISPVSDLVSDPPGLSTVSETLKTQVSPSAPPQSYTTVCGPAVEAVERLAVGLVPVALPSLKLQAHVAGAFVDVSVKVTVSGE